MSHQYKVRNAEGIYFMTLTIVGWIDIFTRIEYKSIIADSLNYCQQEKGLIVYAYCLMTNHIHLIAAAEPGYKLSEIIRDFKKFTNKQIIQQIKTNNESRAEWLLNKFEYAGKYLQRVKDYKVWQDGYHGVELVSNYFIDQKLDYIHQNPVKAGIVAESHHYLYSSAIDYADGKGLVNVVLLQ
ncbi:transposase [Pedobacter sp. BS3]|uniref:REP-associated tyrosine transposase n=1 Tax=Pedobacter sp. BS3 TaxID=2567937 RepID=UPI0011EE7E0D|nr:transposase [Pedobacter sp. BS3]TZF81857.1 transposase [Pedobacter sp. BS3]